MSKESRRFNQLCNTEGTFKSSYPGEVEKGYTLGFLEELCEWLYLHDNLTYAEKLERITTIENMIEEKMRTQTVFSFPINYIRTWSKKLETKSISKISKK